MRANEAGKKFKLYGNMAYSRNDSRLVNYIRARTQRPNVSKYVLSAFSDVLRVLWSSRHF